MTASATTPWLSPGEIEDLCDGLVQPAAQIRYLRDSLRLTAHTKPNGRPLVLRSHMEDVLAGLPIKKRKERPAAAPAQPDVGALVLAFSRK